MHRYKLLFIIIWAAASFTCSVDLCSAASRIYAIQWRLDQATDEDGIKIMDALRAANGSFICPLNIIWSPNYYGFYDLPQDFDAERELRLNDLYDHNLQAMIRIRPFFWYNVNDEAIRNFSQDWCGAFYYKYNGTGDYSQCYSPLAFAEFANVWLENYAKPLIEDCYKKGIYIIDVGTEIIWGVKYPLERLRGRAGYDHLSYPRSWYPYDANTTNFDNYVRPIIVNTYSNLYQWKNKNYPKVILVSSLAGYFQFKQSGVDVPVSDTDPTPSFDDLLTRLGPYYDWICVDGGYRSENTEFYNRIVPYITNNATALWGTGNMEKTFYNEYGAYYGIGPYENYPTAGWDRGEILQSTMEWIASIDPARQYFKVFNQLGFASEAYSRSSPGFAFTEYAPGSVIDSYEDKGTINGFKNLNDANDPGKSWRGLYNRWGNRGTDPSSETFVEPVTGRTVYRSQYRYLKDQVLSYSSEWRDVQKLLLVDNITYDPNQGKLNVKLRNLSNGSLSSAVHVYARAKGNPPWNPAAFVKAKPENIQNSLPYNGGGTIGNSQIAYFPVGSYSVPGNGNLTTTNNTYTLQASYVPANGNSIYVYVEDTDAIKGWTGFNDVPACSNVDMSVNTSNGQVKMIADAQDDDGVQSVQFQYSANGGTNWNDIVTDTTYPFMATLSDSSYAYIYRLRVTDTKGTISNWQTVTKNRLLNPGFEDGMTGWTPRQGSALSGESIDSTVRHSGVNSAKISFTTNNGGYFWQRLNIPAGTTITFSGYIKTTNVSGGGAYLRICFWRKDGTFIPTPDVRSAHVTGTADWTKYTISATVPQEDIYTQIEGDLDEGTGTVWFDDFEAIVGPHFSAPTAKSGVDFTAPANINIPYYGARSVDTDGDITSYSWNFGDGQTGAGIYAGHVYSAEGTYTVTLTVTDNDGLSSTNSMQVFIKGGVPSAPPPGGFPPTASLGTDCVIMLGNIWTFDGSGSRDMDGTIVSYNWDFGDNSAGTGINPVHQYAAPGLYKVTLTVTDNSDLTGTASIKVLVTD